MSDDIIFQCEDSLFATLADGRRRWDMRWWGIADDRIYRLAGGRKRWS